MSAGSISPTTYQTLTEMPESLIAPVCIAGLAPSPSDTSAKRNLCPFGVGDTAPACLDASPSRVQAEMGTQPLRQSSVRSIAGHFRQCDSGSPQKSVLQGDEAPDGLGPAPKGLSSLLSSWFPGCGPSRMPIGVFVFAQLCFPHK